MSTPTIAALGGGGFAPGRDGLVDFVLGLSGKPRPRVCYVGTATGDAVANLASFYRVAARHDCVPSDLPLFARDGGDERATLLGADVVWVGGGNTANLLAVWRVHGVDDAMRAAWEAGVVLAGSSAGMICWFEASITDSFGPQLDPLRDGLGMLPGSACPHYDGEDRRRPVYRAAVADGFPPGYAADDDVALVFRGRELSECVSSRAGASAWRVERGPDGSVVERALPTRVL